MTVKPLLSSIKNEKRIAGAKLMLSNALSLRSAAEDLARAARYGYATSLLVLAAEEALKAVLYYSAGNGLELHPDGLENYQRSHKKRHGLACALLIIVYYVEKTGLEVDDWGAIEERIVEVFKQLFLDVKNHAVPEQVHAVLHWWQRANDLKQKGMYVDEEPGGWSAPSEVSQGTYNETYGFVKPIIDGARVIRVLERSGYISEFRRMFDIDYDALERQLAVELRLEGEPSDPL